VSDAKPDPVQRARRAVAAGLTALAAADPYTTLLRLSLVYDLAIFPSHASERALAVFLLAGIGLVFERALRHPLFWVCMLAAQAYHLVGAPIAYSARFLNLYWTFAVLIASVSDSPLRVLAVNARLLIGLVFLQAFAWKAFAHADFVNGSFMRFSLLFCSAFRELTPMFGIIDPGVYAANSDALAAVEALDGPVEPISVIEPALITGIAFVVTGWTLLIEGLCALAFLSPSRWAVARLRHPALLAFMWSIYLVLPVFVFAGIFSAMALALIEQRESKWRLAYIGTFFAMILLEWGIDVPTIVEALRGGPL
jgi:hypothetical protein